MWGTAVIPLGLEWACSLGLVASSGGSAVGGVVIEMKARDPLREKVSGVGGIVVVDIVVGGIAESVHRQLLLMKLLGSTTLSLVVLLKAAAVVDRVHQRWEW